MRLGLLFTKEELDAHDEQIANAAVEEVKGILQENVDNLVEEKLKAANTNQTESGESFSKFFGLMESFFKKATTQSFEFYDKITPKICDLAESKTIEMYNQLNAGDSRLSKKGVETLIEDKTNAVKDWVAESFQGRQTKTPVDKWEILESVRTLENWSEDRLKEEALTTLRNKGFALTGSGLIISPKEDSKIVTR